MIELKKRLRKMRSEDDAFLEGVTVHPRFSYASMAWVAVGTAVLGAGTSLYGANKQSKDNKAAADQNARLQREQNNASWANWLMTRGVAPTSGVEAGVMPTAGNFNAVNTRLPLWATMTMPTEQPQPGAQPARGRITRRA